ncbi:MAG TPA: hypothetical protein VEJ63_01565 [Planctomycetota bacterium]|nr:hypothetical protein [Planctomycetota bacterium]
MKLPRGEYRQWAYMSWWLPAFFFLAGLNVFLCIFHWFLLTAPASSTFFQPISIYVHRELCDGSAAGSCLMMLKITFFLQLAMLLCSTFLLVRRLKVQVYLLEAILLTGILVVSVNVVGKSGAEFEVQGLPYPMAMQLYGLMAAIAVGLIFMRLLNLQGAVARCVLLVAAALLGLSVAPWAFLIVQPFIAVLACGTTRPFFQCNKHGRRFWPTEPTQPPRNVVRTPPPLLDASPRSAS